ncbi:hypothetical protein B296_00038918 [Ensete ventricosum]|uniref:Uncharacterized protein n=1 Tax=Ensete ventricosum TaxID=4639 RepID=A0A426XCH6_ENSVE|nr:hypothetical protein B296_00038918 [Ensete ventricosum]
MIDSLHPRMRMDFTRWEDGHPTGWLSCTECYFRYHRTTEPSIIREGVGCVGIAAGYGATTTDARRDIFS